MLRAPHYTFCFTVYFYDPIILQGRGPYSSAYITAVTLRPARYIDKCLRICLSIMLSLCALTRRDKYCTCRQDIAAAPKASGSVLA